MRKNIKYFITLLWVSLLFVFTVPAMASIVSLSDNFDNESAGLNYNSFTNWDVVDGSVDSIDSGNYGIDCEGGSGICLDLDGSSGDAGSLVSKESFSPGTYTIQFSLSGHQQPSNSADLVTVSLGDFTESFELDSSDSFMTINRTVNVDSSGGRLTFNHLGGDNYGALLDNVTVSLTSSPVSNPASVPVPATLWLFASGLLGLFGMRRAKK